MLKVDNIIPLWRFVNHNKTYATFSKKHKILIKRTLKVLQFWLCLFQNKKLLHLNKKIQMLSDAVSFDIKKWEDGTNIRTISVHPQEDI